MWVSDQAAAAALQRRNAWAFGAGTLGRDMAYTLISMYLVFYLTEIERPGETVLWWLTIILFAARLFDACLDFVMGAIVDNTRTRWGQFKPWIVVGAIFSSIFTVLLFTHLELAGTSYIIIFSLIYLLWGASWTINDIPYWSLIPALSQDQRRRESMAAIAKIFGTIGLFTVVVGLLPVTQALTGYTGNASTAWWWVALALAIMMLITQTITIVGVKQPNAVVHQERATAREVWRALTKNDQMLWTGLSLLLFATGNITCATFGTYYFKYVYRDEAMYSAFGAVIGIANLLGYITFPLIAKKLSRRRHFSLAIFLVLIGIGIFAIQDRNAIPLMIGGFIMFLAQSWILLIMLVNLSDTVEYGEWKLGKRHGAVTFTLQPFMWKAAAAIATGIVLMTTVVSGISAAQTPLDVSAHGLLTLKVAMLGLPALLIMASFLIFRAKHTLDADRYAQILAELAERRASAEQSTDCGAGCAIPDMGSE